MFRTLLGTVRSCASIACTIGLACLLGRSCILSLAFQRVSFLYEGEGVILAMAMELLLTSAEAQV